MAKKMKSFRFEESTLKKLDDIIEYYALLSGFTPNATSILEKLIEQEHALIQKKLTRKEYEELRKNIVRDPWKL